MMKTKFVSRILFQVTNNKSSPCIPCRLMVFSLTFYNIYKLSLDSFIRTQQNRLVTVHEYGCRCQLLIFILIYIWLKELIDDKLRNRLILAEQIFDTWLDALCWLVGYLFRSTLSLLLLLLKSIYRYDVICVYYGGDTYIMSSAIDHTYFLCVYLFIYVCVYVRVYTYAYSLLCWYVCVITVTCICMCRYVFMHRYMFVHMYLGIYVCMCECECVCLCTLLKVDYALAKVIYILFSYIRYHQIQQIAQNKQIYAICTSP